MTLTIIIIGAILLAIIYILINIMLRVHQLETHLQTERLQEAKVKLNQIMDIAEKQMEIYSQIDQPSKSSLHSKHKNNLNKQFMDLENEKIKLMRYILDELKLDPVIPIITLDGESYDIHLSDLLHDSLPQPPQDEPEPNTPRFKIIDGDKKDTPTT